jgi:DNA-binding Lrp family transcriptional regulator
MVRAYVTLQVEPGKEPDVGQNLMKIGGIAEAALTYGFCDILLKVDVESVEALKNMVFQKLRKIEGVRETQTIIVSEYLI